MGEEVNGWLEEEGWKTIWSKRSLGYIQSPHYDRGGHEGREGEQDQGDTEDSPGEDLVHTRSLGTWRSQDQKRSQGRNGRGDGRILSQESQERVDQVNLFSGKFDPIYLVISVCRISTIKACRCGCFRRYCVHSKIACLSLN